MLRGLALALALAALAVQGASAQVRQYFIAADEIDWDYMPGGKDAMMPGMPLMGYAKFFATRGPHLIGHVYRKAVYREYTDATFKNLKPRKPEDAYLGLLGPIIHAEVGDTIRIVFKNNGSHPYSLHPHGVFYEKASEGSPYDDGVALADKGGDSVAPGKTFAYVWEVPARAGPGPNDPSSIVWLYHSHVNERRESESGLTGAIIVTRSGMARPDGTPKDVDHEFVAFFMIYNENYSWLIDYNAAHFPTDPKHVDRGESIPKDPMGNFDNLIGTGFVGQNFRAAINGYQYGDGPMMTMKKGEHVRWYLVTLGNGFNFHTPHWHGNTVTINGQRTDVVSILPAQMLTADMKPDDPGIWLFHCHISDHMEAGMVARYQVLP
jgi:hephaestin